MRRKKSKRYARALFVLAERNDAVEAVKSSLQILSDLFDRDAAFRILVFTRRIEPGRKIEILSSVLGDQAHRIALEFLAILEEDGEARLLNAILAGYETLYRKKTNRVFVTATTSLGLDEKEYGEIRDRLESSLKKGVDLKKEVNPRLLGGVKLRIGNTFLDGSVSTRLEKLKGSLV